MAGAKTSGELARALGEVARGIREEHGDLAAQTVTYGLFLRRVDDQARVDSLIDGFPDRDAVARVERVLDCSDLDRIFAPYAAEGKDPAIYFYQEFLHAYDSSTSRRRGVHYSPPAVVSYMVRGVESILQSAFGTTLEDALLLDPCCGIGTFLRHIERHYPTPPRAIGIELSLATCNLARTMLRCEVIEADALDSSHSPFPIPNSQVPVVLGNPPYSGHSANAGKIAGLMADYQFGLNERNPKWLQDDYVKFIRMAQHWVDEAGRGLVAFITNHSFLTNPTFRRMRECLMASFDDIHILDLHGNAKRVERALGQPDENVFPIQMGVAVSFMVKTGHSDVHNVILSAARNLPGEAEILRCAQNDNGGTGDRPCRVWLADLRGTREEKLQTLDTLDFEHTPWQEAACVSPFTLFARHDGALQQEYARFPSLVGMFRESSVGFVTSRDGFVVAFTRDELLERIAALRDDRIGPEEIRARYPVGDLDIEATRRALQQDPDWEERAVEVLYRPFDRRWAYLSRAVMERPRLPFMENLLGENLALAVGRAGQATGSHEWDVVFCTDSPADLNLFRRGGAMLFPRYTYASGRQSSNVTLNAHDPERLFAYIYAILHSTEYRARYRDLLMIDFPRIPIPRDDALFEELSKLGLGLVEAHLVRDRQRPHPLRPEPVEGPKPPLRIGGYEIPRKYLVDRRHRESTQADIEQLALIHEAVARTAEIRATIDALVQARPPWVSVSETPPTTGRP